MAKNQPSKTNTGHGSSRCRSGGGTSYHGSKSSSSASPIKSGRTGNTSGGGAKRSKP